MMNRRLWLLSVRGAFIFAFFFLISIFVLPLALFEIGFLLPVWLQNFIFLAPQFALLPLGFHGAFGSLMHVMFPLWGLVALIYGFVTAGLRTRYVVILAYPTWIGLITLESWVFRLLGKSVYLDGP